MRHAMQPRVGVRAAVEGDAKAIVSLHFASVRHYAAGFYAAEIIQLWSPPPGVRRWDRSKNETR